MTAKTVCGNIFADHISEVQISLSGDGENKDIAYYRPALKKVFTDLSEEDWERCNTLAKEWNAENIPDEVVCKCRIFIDLY